MDRPKVIHILESTWEYDCVYILARVHCTQGGYVGTDEFLEAETGKLSKQDCLHVKPWQIFMASIHAQTMDGALHGFRYDDHRFPRKHSVITSTLSCEKHCRKAIGLANVGGSVWNLR